MAQKKFVDDVIDHKEDDIEKIQTRPNMYISYLGQKGALHLSKELINNMIDECVNPHSPANEIDIYLDEVTNTLSVSDNGRGIPFESMEVACTKLQAGSKFTREFGGGSAGENGVGLTAVNALSDVFEIISRRYSKKTNIKFELGKVVQPLTTKPAASDKHGTTTIYKPSPFFMGESCEIPTAELMEWLDKTSHMLPADTTVNFSVNRKGKEANISKKYKNKKGMYDYVKKLSKKTILDPIHFTKSKKFNEFFRGKEVERFFGLEVAFSYNSSQNTEIIADSFCNFVNTIEGGQHLDGVRVAITHFITKKTREALSEKESKKLDIQTNDAASGLVLALYVSTSMDPEFASQTKEKVSRSEIFKICRDMTFSVLEEHFRVNPKDLKKLVDYVKTNAKARIEATKVRNSVIKGTTNSLDEHSIKGFTPAIARGKHDYRELLLIEGESAAGSLDQEKFNQFQASFGLKGVPLNTFGLKMDKILKNDEFRALVKILKANVGDKFDITKIWYKKIIIMTDSDVDGFRISSLICTFFIMHMPQLVEQGYLYKAVAPLYRIKDAKKPFILSKKEFIDVFERRIGGNIRLIKPDSSVMKSSDFKEFLFINRDYLEELQRLSNHFGVHKQIVEFVAIHGDEKDFSKKLNKRFPEITVDKDNILSGIFEGRYQVLSLDKQFNKRANDLKTYIHKFNEGRAYYGVHEKIANQYVDQGILTIGDLMTLCQKFQPEIITRYKGLGELDPVQLKQTTLDPNNRLLIKLTLKDLEEEVKKFRVLHGDSSEERKELMAHFKINREDLDN